LSPDEKRQALNTWEQDARQMLTASNEGMEGDEEGLDQRETRRLAEVERESKNRRKAQAQTVTLDAELLLRHNARAGVLRLAVASVCPTPAACLREPEDRERHGKEAGRYCHEVCASGSRNDQHSPRHIVGDWTRGRGVSEA
jgi:hypothetical protein